MFLFINTIYLNTVIFYILLVYHLEKNTNVINYVRILCLSIQKAKRSTL